MSPDQGCYDLIKRFEGDKLRAYQDSKGVWTIGYGTIIYENNIPVKKGDVITQERAEELLKEGVLKKSVTVSAALGKTALSQNQYNALVSFAYNVGVGALLGSSLLKAVKAKPSDPAIRDSFMMWDKIHLNGKLVEVEGLKNRRKMEADLYFS